MTMKGIAPEGRPTHHLSLRFNAKQRWYHYPQMTADELLVFKLGNTGRTRRIGRRKTASTPPLPTPTLRPMPKSGKAANIASGF